MNFSEYNLWFFALIVLLGFAGGFLAGMLGVGGGLVFVPVFQEIVKNHEIAADRVPYVLANSLLIVFVVGISGSIKHIKIKNTNLQAALTTGLAAVFSSSVLPFISGVSIPFNRTDNLYKGDSTKGNLDAIVMVSPS